MSGYLNAEQILGAQDLGGEDVDVPEWGGKVRVRMLSGTERDAFEASIVGKSGKERNLANLRARLCALCMVDGDGKRLFDDRQVKDLGAKSSAALSRVFDRAMELNGLRKEDVDELAGN